MPVGDSAAAAAAAARGCWEAAVGLHAMLALAGMPGAGDPAAYGRGASPRPPRTDPSVRAGLEQLGRALGHRPGPAGGRARPGGGRARRLLRAARRPRARPGRPHPRRAAAVRGAASRGAAARAAIGSGGRRRPGRPSRRSRRSSPASVDPRRGSPDLPGSAARAGRRHVVAGACRASPAGSSSRSARMPSRPRRCSTESPPSPGMARVSDSSGRGQGPLGQRRVDLAAHQREERAQEPPSTTIARVEHVHDPGRGRGPARVPTSSSGGGAWCRRGLASRRHLVERAADRGGDGVARRSRSPSSRGCRSGRAGRAG